MRVDAGVEEGDEVSVHYDPMLAKVIVWAPDRTQALARLQAALEATEVEGVRTNARFLWQVLGAPAVRDGDVSTRLLETDPTLGRGVPEVEITEAWLLAAAARLRALPGDEQGRSLVAGSPWQAATGFRVNGHRPFACRCAWIRRGTRRPVLPASRNGTGWHSSAPPPAVDRQARGRVASHSRAVSCDGTGARAHRRSPRRRAFETDHDRLILRRQCLRFDFIEDTGGEHRVSAEHEGHFRAPMPGHVLDVRVQVGQVVDKGAVLLVLEAMKMEHSLTAPWPAKVTEIKVQAGQRVEEGTDLIQLEPAS